MCVGEETGLSSADSYTPGPNPALKEQSSGGVSTLLYYPLRLSFNGSYNYTPSVGSAPSSSLPALLLSKQWAFLNLHPTWSTRSASQAWLPFTILSESPFLSLLMLSSEVPKVSSWEFLSCGKQCVCLGFLPIAPLSPHASFSHPT